MDTPAPESTSTPSNSEAINKTSEGKLPPNISADELFELYDDSQDDPAVPARPKEFEGKEKPLVKTALEGKTGLNSDKTSDGSSKEDEGLKPKAKLGDSEVDIPEEAILTRKVNGKDVEFKVSDAIKAYTTQEEFNRNMDRRIGAAEFKEKRFLQDKDQARQNLGRIVDAAQKGDISLAVRVMAEMIQQDPVEFEKAYLPNLQKEIDQFSRMSPTEKELYYAKRREESLSRELKSKKSQEDYNRDLQALETHVSGLRSKYNLSEQQFFNCYQELVDSGSFKDPNTDIKPETVIEYYQHKNHVSKVMDGIKKINPEMAQQQKFFDDIYRLTWPHQEFSVDDISDIVNDILNGSTKTVESLNQKVNKNAKNGFGTQVGKVSSQNGKNQEYDDEIVDDLYRKAPVRRY